MHALNTALSRVILLPACALPLLLAAPSLRAQASEAAEILRLSGVKGGMIVHLGCGDGRLTAALHPNDRYTVHGLEADSAQVPAAREYVRSRGLYGPVSIEHWRGATLPYVDHLINLLVVEKP